MVKQNRIYAGTREKWRKWLSENHKKEERVYLVKHKRHTGKPSLNNIEAMEEAICFGWIDTILNRIDDERYSQCFVKRNKNSRWSRNTLKRAREMIAQKKMTSVGLKMYKEGLEKPTIDHNLPRNPAIPVEVKKALGKNLKKFESLAPSKRRLYLYMYLRAKRPETKEKRIKDIMKLFS